MSHECVGAVCQHFDHAVGYDEADRRLHRAEQLLARVVKVIEENGVVMLGRPDLAEVVVDARIFLGWL